MALRLNGSTSGYVELNAPAVAGSQSLTIPYGILQVVQTELTTPVSFASSSFVDLTGYSVSITPSSTSSKILVTYNLTLNTQTQNFTVAYRLVRNSTVINVGTNTGNRAAATGMSATVGGGDHPMTHAGTFLDTPSTTSQITYKIQAATEGGISCFLNRNYNGDYVNTSDPKYSRTASNIIVMEVAG